MNEKSEKRKCIYTKKENYQVDNNLVVFFNETNTYIKFQTLHPCAFQDNLLNISKKQFCLFFDF